ncbi:hypothetical protein A9Q75_08760 [Colwellia psychrerythraea]|uniref:Uncharacterized protein n=1 Tax=Colwellia psychrerythraea TaxID=28229 RepID=A0A1Y5EKD1_COLPS|nr:hypothetical protein A9Q75_08760 [Colwellia psychrerythraea]
MLSYKTIICLSTLILSTNTLAFSYTEEVVVIGKRDTAVNRWDSGLGHLRDQERSRERRREDRRDRSDRRNLRRCNKDVSKFQNTCVRDKDLEISKLADTCYIATAAIGGATAVWASPITGVVVTLIGGTACNTAKHNDLAKVPVYCTNKVTDKKRSCKRKYG